MKIRKKRNVLKKNTTNTKNILEGNQKKKGLIKNIGIEDNLQEIIKNIEKIHKKAEITKF
jgi:predicted Zn-dependent protease